MIPKTIFQTQKSIEWIKKNPKLIECTNSWKALCPEYEYHFFNDSDIEHFIRTKYGGLLYKAYKRAPFPVMKADMWRYCVVHYYGGIYADSDTKLLVSPDIFHKEDALFVGVPENSVHLCQWIFAAPKQSPILESVIECIADVFNEIDDFSDPHITHRTTGPGIFSLGIEKYLKSKGLPTFKNKLEYTDYIDKRLHIYNAKDFHTNKVLHMYSGFWEGGWCRIRDEYVKNITKNS